MFFLGKNNTRENPESSQSKNDWPSFSSNIT
jgi:hypothetical protein